MKDCEDHNKLMIEHSATLARIEQKLDDLREQVPMMAKDIEECEDRLGVVEGITKGTRSRLGWAIAIAVAVLAPFGYLAVVLIEHIGKTK